MLKLLSEKPQFRYGGAPYKSTMTITTSFPSTLVLPTMLSTAPSLQEGDDNENYSTFLCTGSVDIKYPIRFVPELGRTSSEEIVIEENPNLPNYARPHDVCPGEWVYSDGPDPRANFTMGEPFPAV